MSLNGGWSQPNQALSPESFNPMMLQKELMHAWEEEKPQPGMSVAELRRRFEMANDNQNATERVSRTPTRTQEEPQYRRQEYVPRKPVPTPREYEPPEREEYVQQEYDRPTRYNYSQQQQYNPMYAQREYIQPERDTYHQKENIMPQPRPRPASASTRPVSASPKQVASPQSQIIVPSPKSVSARKKAINQQKERAPRKQVRSIYNTIQQDLYHQQEFEQQHGPRSGQNTASVPAKQHIPEPTLSNAQRHASWSGMIDDDQEVLARQSGKVPPPPPRRKTPVGYAYQRPYSYHSSAHNADTSLGFTKPPEEYRTDKKMRQEDPVERDDDPFGTEDAYADQIRKMMKKTTPTAQFSPIRPAKFSTERLVGPSDEAVLRYAKAQEPTHVRRSPKAKLQSEGLFDSKYKKVQWGDGQDTKASYERPESATRESPQYSQNRYTSPAAVVPRYVEEGTRQSPIPRSTSWNQQHIPEREEQDRSTISIKKSVTIDSLQPRASFSESEPGESVSSLDDKVNSYLEMKGFKPKTQEQTSEPVQRRPQRNRAKFTNRESYVYRDSTPSPQQPIQSYEPVQRSSPRPASIDFPPPPPELLEFPPPPPLEYTTSEIVHSTQPTSVVSSTAYDRDDYPGQLNSNTTQTDERFDEPRRDRDYTRVNLQLRQQTEERVNSYPSSDAEDEESSSNYSFEQSSPERRSLQKKFAGIPRSPVIDFKDFLENGEEQNSKADDIKFQRYPVQEDEQRNMSRENRYESSASSSVSGFPLHRTEEVWSISQTEDAPSSEYQIFEAPVEPGPKESPEFRAPSERKKERKQVQKRPSMKDLQGRTQDVIKRHSRENLSSTDRRGEVDSSGSSPTLTPSESGTETEDRPSPREWRRRLQQQDLAEREQKYWKQEEERMMKDEDERAAKVAAVKERRDSEKRAWMEDQERIERMQRDAEERQRLEEDRRRLMELKKREDQRKAEEQARQAEEQARREVDERLRRQAEERTRQEAEERAKWEAQQRARREAEIREREEAEQRAQQEMEQARREAEERAYREAELKARREAEERAQREAEEMARIEAEERARREAEEEAKREAEIRARIEAEQRAQLEAEERARREAEERARREEEEQARREAEERARTEVEERARREAKDRARREAEEQARKEAEERALREAEQHARREAEEHALREAQEQKRREDEERARKDAEAAEIRARLEREDRIRREVAEQADQELMMAQKAAEEQTRKERELRAKLEADKQAEIEARKMWEAAEKSVKEAEERAKRASENRVRKEQEVEQKISPPRERAKSDTEEVSAKKPPIPAPRRRNQSEAPEETSPLKRGAKDRMSLRELKDFTRGTILRLSSRSLSSYASEPPPDLKSDIMDGRSPDSGGGSRLRKKVPSLKDLKSQTRDHIIGHSRDSLAYRRSQPSLSSPGPLSGDDDDDDYYVPFNDYDSDDENASRRAVPPCMRPHRRKGPGSKSADPLQRRSFHEMPQDGQSSDLPPVRVTIPIRGAKSTEAIVQQKKKNMTVEVTLVPRASIENLETFKPEVKVTNNPLEYKKLTGSMPELSDDGSEKKSPSGSRSNSRSDFGARKGRSSRTTQGDTGYSSVTSDDSPDNVPSRPRSWKGSVSLDTEGMENLLEGEKQEEKKEPKSPKKSPKSKTKKKSGTFPRFKQDQKQERPRARVQILLHGQGSEDPQAPYYETEV